MAVTKRTLRLLDDLRRVVGRHTDDTVRTLTAAWTRTWDALSPEVTTAVDDVVDLAATTGQWPDPWQLNRLERLARAEERAARSLAALAATAQNTTVAGAYEVIAATAEAEPEVIASQLPTSMIRDAVARYAAKTTPRNLEAIAARCTQQVTQVLRPLSADATQAMRRALAVGIGVGGNPLNVGRELLRRVEGAFNGGLARANNVARTEILDAYRDTSAQVHRDNADVLTSWIWSSALDPRTCPSCWGMHGTVHPLSQPGPLDHQNGRCVRLPKAKAWFELGIDIAEPGDVLPDATAEFAALPRADQLAVMGPSRLALLDSGRIRLADLPARRESSAWRPSYTPKPVRELELLPDRRLLKP